jgi:TetR/AcrR family transcriptional regulator, regulator of autoinduction and epiphytic fitness
VTEPVSTDGRVARGERTRAAIATAFLDLVTEGDPRPGGRRIAERAGVSVRSIFQHFEDLESLREEVLRVQTERVRPLVEDLDTTGDLDHRISALVHQRGALFEFIAPLRRSMTYVERGPAIEVGIVELGDLLRHQVGEQFRPELDAIPAHRRASVLAALDAMCAYESWDQLRRGQGLTEAQSRRAVTVAVEQLLGP